MTEPRIALVSLTELAYSETFIQAHKTFLHGKVFFFYGGVPPKFMVGSGRLQSSTSKLNRIVHFGRTVLQWNNKKDETINQYIFKKALIKNRINVVFVEYGHVAARILPICLDLGIPLIAHFHGLDASLYHVLESYKERYKVLFRHAVKVIAVSKYMRDTLFSLGAKDDQVLLNPYGPDESFFEVGASLQEKSFIAIGRFVEKKAPHLTLLAFSQVLKKHPEARLIMAGDGPLLGVCKSLARHLGISDKVQFLGIIDRSEYQKWLSKARAMVQHSVRAEDGDMEGTPVAILEAQAAGVPVVSTRHGGIPDVVLEKQTGFLVEENDINGMAAAMCHLLEDLNLAREMGATARTRISGNFSMEKHISALNKLVQEAIVH